MRDLWNLFRGSLPRLERLSYAFEKGGLVLDNQPIPWCADHVAVQAAVHLSQHTPRSKGDFELRVGTETVLPENCRMEEDACRLSFRVPVPAKTTAAELLWRSRSLGQVALPLLSEDEFIRKFSLQLPTTSVRLGHQTIACQCYVTTQCQGVICSAHLYSPTSLVPLADLGLRVEVRREDGGLTGSVAVTLSSSQLRAQQALVAAAPPKPKRMGAWTVTWLLGDRPLASQTLRAISQRQFLRSLRVTGAQFVVQTTRGTLRVEPTLPKLKGVARVGPCFSVTSSEPGMAGICKLQVRAHIKGAVQPPLVQEQEVLLTDGPLAFVAGTLDVEDLEQLKHFELRCGRDLLGTLPLAPVPSASFNQEGGFVAADAFEWSATAEEQFKERLGKLLGPS